MDTADALAEGAALKLGIAARDLSATAASIARAGRIGQLPLLRADAEAVTERAERLLEILGEQEAAGKVLPREDGAAPAFRATAVPVDPDAPAVGRPPEDPPSGPTVTTPAAPEGPAAPGIPAGERPSGPAVASPGAPGGAASYPPPAR